MPTAPHREAVLPTWAAMVDAAAGDDRLSESKDALMQAAAHVAGEPIVRRVHRYEDVGRLHRTWLDGRAKPLDEPRRTTFALAMSDFDASGILSVEAPLLATSLRLTGESKYADRLIAQLVEAAAWKPIQRWGWTCYHADAAHPPNDGNWLATGRGIRGLAMTLDLAPEGSLPASLVGQLRDLLAREIGSIMQDWRDERPWFVRSKNAITNQWVLPTEGLVTACVALGIGPGDPAYEAGADNLLKAIEAHGRYGEFEEGIGYASFTIASMLHAAHAMGTQGDRRALDQPFLQAFPTWAVHHLMPGRQGINAFDAGRASPMKRDDKPMRDLFSLFAAMTHCPVAAWALRDQFAGPNHDVVGFAAAAALDAIQPERPATFASYDKARRVNWRDDWADAGAGLWMRGGHADDQHDHQDRGHLSYYVAGRPILIEAGTPTYEHPQLASHWASCLGHNVLQIGDEPAPENAPAGQIRQHPPQGWQLARTVAPIHIDRLDRTGGDVTMDGSACYESVDHWRRRATWSADQLTVVDDVALRNTNSDAAGDAADNAPAATTKEQVTFRWHTASERPVTLESADNHGSIIWAGGRIDITADQPFTLTQEMRENHTLDAKREDAAAPYAMHACVNVRTTQPVSQVTFTTRVSTNRSD